MSGRCEIRLDGNVTCQRGSKGCYVDHEAHDLGLALMSIPGYEPGHGMVNADGDAVSFVSRGQVYIKDSQSMPIGEFVPNLKAAQSRGVLLEQLRDQSRIETLSVLRCGECDGAWVCKIVDGIDALAIGHGRSALLAEIDALLYYAQTGVTW